MTNAIQLLKDRYLKNIKEKPTIYVGIELEFPLKQRSLIELETQSR